MMNSYDLFSALSGADEELVARSDFRIKRHKYRFAMPLTAAACLVIALIGTISLIPDSHSDTLSTQPTSEMFESQPISTEPDQPLQLQGSDVGTLNIIQLSHVADARTMPDFLMYVNQEDYRIAEASGTYYIYPIASTENTPTCQMTLTWQADATLENAAQQQATVLREKVATVSEPTPDTLIDGLLVQGNSGSSWDSARIDVYITSDHQGGVFIFTLEYYQGDTDGHAIWFRDMMQTFEVITTDLQAPDWMAELRATVTDVTSAFLKNDFSDVQDLLSENAEIYTYDSNVYSDTRLLNIHYKVDNDSAPTSAYVSVRHKYLEDDSYDYITMELTYIYGKWKTTFAGIEP